MCDMATNALFNNSPAGEEERELMGSLIGGILHCVAGSIAIR